MLKIPKMLAVVLAVSALALSATPAIGDATWTGAVNNNWSNMGNWSGDPTAGGTLTLNIAGNSIVDVDMTDGGVWATTPNAINLQNASHTITVPTGGVISHLGSYFRLHSGTLRMDGGTLEGPGYFNVNIANNTDATIEFLGGTWNTMPGAPTYYAGLYQPGNIHVIGKTAGSDFAPLQTRKINPDNATFEFTLEAGEGIDKIRFTDPNPIREVQNANTIPLTVNGIQDYLDAGGTQLVWDLITGASDPDMLQFQTGDVYEGGNLMGSVTATSTAVTLTIFDQGGGGGPDPSGDIPEPATMCALGLAVAGLGGYVRKRRKA